MHWPFGDRHPATRRLTASPARQRNHWAVAALGSLLVAACVTVSPAPTQEPEPSQSAPGHCPGPVTVLSRDGARQSVNDVAQALTTYAPGICQALEHDYEGPVVVELFPDQASLDANGLNARMKGYYAYSAGNRIQMVAPENEIPQFESEYPQRVLIVVHEFAHLVIASINPEAPLWLNEGIAIYTAPHEVYTRVCEHAFPFAQIPKLDTLEKSYASVPAADLFAYTLVEYIVDTYGQATVNRLLRTPTSLQDGLGVPQPVLEQEWQRFMEEHYSGGGTDVRSAGQPN